MAILKLGDRVPVCGDITSLNAVGVLPAENVERNLGFGPGRLAQGYWLLLLKQPLLGGDFELGGTTMRSGGRLGLPGQTAADDMARARVQDEIVRERGQQGYADMKAGLARDAKISGPERLCKVIPFKPHDASLPPADQYPMGGGFKQWTIARGHEKEFLVAMVVDATGLAKTPALSGQLKTERPADLYDFKAKLLRWLQQA